MKFFNSQEEVLDIQLTQVGKRNLAKGLFKPSYYAFFDSDILYDAECAGFSEVQNTTVPRIVDDTPRLRTQYMRDGAEANFKKLKIQRLLGKKISNETMDRGLEETPIGTSTGNEYLPAWKIRLAEGEIINVALYHTASWGVSFTPQVSSSVNIRTRVEFDESLATASPEEAEDGNLLPGRPLFNPEGSTGTLSTEQEPDVYPDGSYLLTEQASLLLDIAEINNVFKDENFDIEVFEIITESAGCETKEILRPLKFISSESFSQKDEKEISDEVKIPDTGHVGHYVEILVDGELDMNKFTGRKGVGGAGLSPYGHDDFDPDDLKEPC